MKLKKSLVFAIVLLLSLVDVVSAATISVTCQVNASRSRVTVAGAGLSVGVSYFAQIRSIEATPQTRTSAMPFKTANVAGAIAYIFDSDAAAVTAGATRIEPNFIKNQTVIGYIRRSGTNVLIGAMQATCAPF